MKTLVIALISFPFYLMSQDIVFVEVLYNPSSGPDIVTLLNTTDDSAVQETIDISTWYFCSRITYSQLMNSNVLDGSLNLAAGETVTLALVTHDLNDGSADLGLYTAFDFTNADAMVDFVQWGGSFDETDNPGGRENRAVEAGLWVDEAFVESAAVDEILTFDGTNGGGGELSLVSDFENIVLPVTMLYFTAFAGEKVYLQWATASEFNSSHFELKRGRDEFSLEKIAELTAAGFSHEVNEYKYEDHPGSDGKYFYQLIQVDQDGEEHGFGLRSVTLTRRSSMLRVLPTVQRPGGEIMILVGAAPVENEDIRLFDPAGREVVSWTLEKDANTLQVRLPPGLLPGTYYVFCPGLKELSPIIVGD